MTLVNEMLCQMENLERLLSPPQTFSTGLIQQHSAASRCGYRSSAMTPRQAEYLFHFSLRRGLARQRTLPLDQTPGDFAVVLTRAGLLANAIHDNSFAGFAKKLKRGATV
ncbi:MAG: hypothetical protein IPG83_14195 [Novosphingobium sp.]|nr:hypothetical protein [Novosphingobium sp.]